MITHRSWNTIQAALTLWLEMCRTSRVKPHMHPKVQPFFQGDRPTPLTAAEIEAVINSDPVADRCLGYPAVTMADLTGLTPARIHLMLQDREIRPTGRIGRTPLWDWADLRQVADDLLARDRVFRNKYGS